MLQTLVSARRLKVHRAQLELPSYRLIPAGRFVMGNDEPGACEGPSGAVFVSSFWCAGTVTTNAEFAAFVRASGYRTTAETGASDTNWAALTRDRWDHPVVMVSWYDAEAYTQWLSATSGLRFRLPSEAEWEKAARGQRVGAIYPWGDEAPERVGANFGHLGRSAVPRTVAVDRLPVNDLGLHFGGNVWEWVQDWFAADAYLSRPEHDPRGPAAGSFRVRRGGAFNNRRAFRLRVSSRNRLAPEATFANMGFRVVCEEDPSRFRRSARPDAPSSIAPVHQAHPASELEWDTHIRTVLLGRTEPRERVEAVLDVLRPSMNEDHGNVRVESVDAGRVSLRLEGTCRACPKSQLTFEDLAATLRRHLPEIVGVERIGD